jgi:hypothetical protein
LKSFHPIHIIVRRNGLLLDDLPCDQVEHKEIPCFVDGEEVTMYR